MIRFSCKWCGKRYKVDDRHAGRSNHCRKCGKPVWIPLAHLHFSCPKCGKHYRTSVRYQGVTLPCRACGAAVTAPAAFQKQAAVKEPDYTPFELSVDDEPIPEQEIEGPKVPFELTDDEPPEAELILDVNKLPEADSPEPPPVALADTASQSLSLPLAELADLPAAPQTPGVASTGEHPVRDTDEWKPAAPEAAARKAEPPRRQSIKKDDFPVAKMAGCPRCGEGAVFAVAGRSRQAVVVMIASGLLGLLSVALINVHWIFALVTLACFAVSGAASLRKTWTRVCAKCRYSYPADDDADLFKP